MKKYNTLQSFYNQPKDGKKITKEQEQARKGFTKNRETGKVTGKQLGKLNYWYGYIRILRLEPKADGAH